MSHALNNRNSVTFLLLLPGTFCLFDANYQKDENNNEDDDVSITATNFLFQVLWLILRIEYIGMLQKECI